jgi:hypothetical protein
MNASGQPGSIAINGSHAVFHCPIAFILSTAGVATGEAGLAVTPVSFGPPASGSSGPSFLAGWRSAHNTSRIRVNGSAGPSTTAIASQILKLSRTLLVHST